MTVAASSFTSRKTKPHSSLFVTVATGTGTGTGNDTGVVVITHGAIVVGIFPLVYFASIAAAVDAGAGTAILLAVAPCVSSGRRHQTVFASSVVVFLLFLTGITAIAYHIAQIEVIFNGAQHGAVHRVLLMLLHVEVHARAQRRMVQDPHAVGH